MSRTIVLFATVLAVTLTTSACGPSTPKTVSLAEKDASSTVELRPGDMLEVVLAGNPTTGYSWAVQAVDKDILKQMGEPAYKADSNLIGSGGQFTFRFEAVAAGQTALKLFYQRPWEKDTPPIQTFVVAVIVK